MTKREISKYNSYAQIGSTLELHAPVFSEHVQLVKGADDFAGFLERLDALSTRQSAQTGGVAKDKARLATARQPGFQSGRRPGRLRP